MSRPVPVPAPALASAILASAAVLLLATDASAGALRLDADFAQPLVTETISVKVEKYFTDNLGFTRCDSSYTTKAPAFTFELTEAHPELRVRFEESSGYPARAGAVIKFPNNKYFCANALSQVYSLAWPKGTYEVWLYGPSADLSARLRFENPARSKQAVADARAKMPTVTLGGGGDGDGGGVNPSVTRLERVASAEAADLALDCVDVRQRAMPLAALAVTKESSFYLSTAIDLFIVTADGACVQPRSSPVLAVGTHALWGVVPEGGAPKTLSIEVEDRKRPFQPRDATRHAVGDLGKALVIDGTVRAAEGWGRRGGCGGTAFAPDFYLTSDRPLQGVELSLLWGPKPMSVHVFGPLEQATATQEVSCGKGGDQPRAYDLFEGTYAVWVGTDTSSSNNGKLDATGTAYHVVLRRKDVPVYPMTTFAPIAAELTMAERAIDHHYPYFDEGGRDVTDDYYENWKTIFTQAPDQLFVYARVDIDDAEVTVKAGEPLLVESSGSAETIVRRHDGGGVRVKTQLLTIDRPDTPWLPAQPEIPAYEAVNEAREEAGPEDQAGLDAFDKLWEKYEACYLAYMEKNDPTWGTGNEVYRISGSGRVTNVGSEVSDRADAKCGLSKFEKHETRLLKELAKTRTARHTARLAAVRQRFGLRP